MIVDVSQLENLRKETNKKIVLATGTFDLFHFEHLKYLQDAKKQGDILIVAVKDNACARLKGTNRPIIDESQRIEIVDNIKCVDYTVLVHYEENEEIVLEYDNEAQYQWLKMFEKIFRQLNPDILYYEENTKLQTARNRILSAYDVQGVSRIRTAIVSTTKIIEKLAKE
ncbi:MAG: adenylyltransferase/cytidyltransferase family protein [Clostridia bacterium]|nr:adenylyltransferase/cytidyltransferase family protein [Clostridia bacterium]